MKRNPPLPYKPLSHASSIKGLMDFPLKYQRTEWTCGPACLVMVGRYFGKRMTEKKAAQILGTHKKWGTYPIYLWRGLAWCCNSEYCDGMKVAQLKRAIDKGRPVVVLWDDWKGHYAVAIGYDKKYILLADPANRKSGLRLHTWETFTKHWPTTVDGVKYHNFGIICHPL